MEELIEDYAVHIRNKALFSYTGSQNAERLAEYLAEQILEKRNFERLKKLLDGVWEKLNDTDKYFARLKYFPDEKNAEESAFGGDRLTVEKCAVAFTSERNYFRRQNKLLKKVGALLRSVGLTEDTFLKEFGKIPVLRIVYKNIKNGKERKMNRREKRAIEKRDFY